MHAVARLARIAVADGVGKNDVIALRIEQFAGAETPAKLGFRNPFPEPVVPCAITTAFLT